MSIRYNTHTVNEGALKGRVHMSRDSQWDQVKIAEFKATTQVIPANQTLGRWEETIPAGKPLYGLLYGELWWQFAYLSKEQAEKVKTNLMGWRGSRVSDFFSNATKTFPKFVAPLRKDK
jgi:hypothetical protein